jgi:hypothetical protein
MSNPTSEELNIALKEAARLREQDEDMHFIGKSLMNLNYRIYYLEKALKAAKEFLHTGLGAKEHTDLLHAIEKADKASNNSIENEGNPFI